jgi:predicted MPP superfamily phosphohydrolase
MTPLFPLIFGLTMLIIFSSLEIILIRTLNKIWWKYKPVRLAAYILPLVGIISVITWFGSTFYNIRWLSHFSSIAVSASLVMLLALTLSLPISGVLHQIHRLLEKRKQRQMEKAPDNIDQNRRIILKGTAAALPLITLSMSAGGVARAFQNTRVYKIPISYYNLPQQLNGFKILHLTDSHLGIYRFLNDLEETLSKAESFHPDLVLYTGDIADNLDLLPDALKMAASLKPQYGAYASLGNHEYYRGINRILDIFAGSPVRLLKSSGTAINVNGFTLYLAGADDPRHLGQDNTAFLDESVRNSISGASNPAFRILMCHRPEGFISAADQNIDLTLSGHTHGGQIGFAGRSLLEPLMPRSYLWGLYNRGKSRMYLSSGIGHWFPFRLGCPPEAPVIELVSSD